MGTRLPKALLSPNNNKTTKIILVKLRPGASSGLVARSTASHGPVVGFVANNPFLNDLSHHHKLLPDIVTQEPILQNFYCHVRYRIQMGRVKRSRIGQFNARLKRAQLENSQSYCVLRRSERAFR